MTFSDLNFIFRLLPIFLIIYYLTPAKVRPWTLLLESLLFYYINEPRLIVVLAAGTVVTWCFAKINIYRRYKWLLALGILLDVSLLGFFKACGVLKLGLVIPIGLSYFVFKLISYQVDSFRGMISGVSFINMANYLLMFPQIISGPIARFDFMIENAFWRKSEEKASARFYEVISRIEDGLKYFALGLFFKIIIADHLAILWNDIKTIGYESISTPLAWLGAYTYSLDLYFDFWGYSLMAAGVGVMLGFPFIRNFDQPYFASSISDFYRRWHSTLGSWFRDYVYFPLGGNRKGWIHTAFNLMVVWLFTGLWHGVTINFLIWAGAICLIIMIEKFILSHVKWLYMIIGRINVLVLIPVTWVIFAIHSFKDLKIYLLRLFPVWDVSIAVNSSDYIKCAKTYWPFLALGLFFVMPFVTSFYKKHKDNVFVVLGLFGLFWVAIFSLANSSGNPFMYLRF